MPSHVPAYLRIVTHPRFQYEPLYVKVATLFIARSIENYAKWILDSERTFKIKATSG